MHSKEAERTEVPRMEALARREKHLWIDYQDTLESRKNLAVVYRFQGRYDTADVLLTGYKKHLVAEDPYTVDSLAVLYRLQGPITPTLHALKY